MKSTGTGQIRRRGATALLAGVTAFGVTFTAVPAALAAPASAAEPAGVTAVQEEPEPITVDDIRLMIEQFEATGEVTFAGARRLLTLLRIAEFYIDLGVPSRGVHSMELFKEQASDPHYVPSESARDQLIAAADQLIAQMLAA
ncbi:MAG: FIMAH domain-containing protein [Planctomycetaceae bacterium]